MTLPPVSFFDNTRSVSVRQRQSPPTPPQPFDHSELKASAKRNVKRANANAEDERSQSCKESRITPSNA